MADTISFCFAGGESELVPASYVEFAERLVLPQFADLKVTRPARGCRQDRRHTSEEQGAVVS
jgi:hypothetical protein